MLNNDPDKGLVKCLTDTRPPLVVVDGKEMPLEDLLSRMLGTIRRHGRGLFQLLELDKAVEIDKVKMVFPEDNEPNKK